VLLLKARRTGRTIEAECCHRGNIISGSHRVLLPGDRGSAATEGTSYRAYDRGEVLSSREYYRRKPQGTATGESYKRKLLRETGAVNYNYGDEYLILTSQFRYSSSFKGNIK